KEAGWQYRETMWQGTTKMVAAKPIFGFGPGAYPLHQSEFTHIGGHVTESSRASLGEQAHNFYLQTAAELGIPACLLLVASMVVFLVRGFLRLKTLDVGVRKNLLLAYMPFVVAFATGRH